MIRIVAHCLNAIIRVIQNEEHHNQSHTIQISIAVLWTTSTSLDVVAIAADYQFRRDDSRPLRMHCVEIPLPGEFPFKLVRITVHEKTQGFHDGMD